MAVALSCGAAVVRAGSLLVRRTHAQACADAVALALVTGGVDTAQQVAHTSHSVIVDESVNGSLVRVTVRTGGVTTTATATG